MARFKILFLIFSLAFETAIAGGGITCVETVSPEEKPSETETAAKPEVTQEVAPVATKAETPKVVDPLEKLLTYRAKSEAQIAESASELLASIQKRVEDEPYGIYEVIVSEVIRAQIKGLLEEHAQLFHQFGTRDGVKKAQDSIKDINVLIEHAQGLISSISEQQEGSIFSRPIFSSREGVIKKKADEFRKCYSNLNACSLDLGKALEDLTKSYKISQALIIKTQDELTVLADVKSRITDAEAQFFINRNMENLAQSLELLKTASKTLKDVIVSGKIQIDETIPDLVTSARRLVYAGAPESLLHLDSADKPNNANEGSTLQKIEDIKQLKASGVFDSQALISKLRDISFKASSFTVEEYTAILKMIPLGLNWGMTKSYSPQLVMRFNHGTYGRDNFESMATIVTLDALSKVKIRNKSEKAVMMKNLTEIKRILEAENTHNNYNEKYMTALKMTVADIVLKASEGLE